MVKEKQFDIFDALLKQFQVAGVLPSIMLIGSWCLYFYRTCLKNTDKLPAVRTLDVDFLVPNAKKISREVNIPAIMTDLGFIPTRSHMSGLVVYDHPELRAEFLVPELGRANTKPVEIKKLHVNAQGLRYLNLLADYPRKFSVEGVEIVLPEPAAFAVHKLIISARRTKPEKHQKDLETAIEMLNYVFSSSEELHNLKSILKSIPDKWRGTIKRLAELHYPPLVKIIDEL